MADTIEQLFTLYGNRVPYDNELAWLKTQGADADEISLGNAWQTVLTASGYWVGNPADSIVNWLQSVTGLTSRDIGHLTTYALDNGLYYFVRTFGELAQWYYNGFRIDEDGRGLAFQSPYYPIQIKSKVAKGNGSNSEITITGITQTINATTDYKIRFRSTISASGAGEMFIDSRNSSQAGGFIVFKDPSHDMFLRVQVDGSNYRTVIFTPTIRTGAKYEVWFKTSGIRLFENDVELTPNSDTLTGTMSNISNSNDWVLLQRADKTNATVSNQSISDVEAVGSNYLSLQEGNGQIVFDKVTGFARKASNLTWALVEFCSHESSRKGFTKGHYLDGTNDWVLTSGVLSTIVSATTEIRITAYFYISSIVGSPMVVSFDDGSDGLLNMGISSSTGQMFLFVPNGLLATALGTTVVSLNEIHKAELVLDVTGDTGYVYLDDGLEITAPLTEATMTTVLSVLTRMVLGQELDASSPSNFLGGLIVVQEILVDSVDITDGLGYTPQSGALPMEVPTNYANSNQNCLGELHGKDISKLNSELIEVNTNPDSNGTLTTAGAVTDYQKGDSPSANADKRVIGNAEDRLMIGSDTTYQSADGYDDYMDDVA